MAEQKQGDVLEVIDIFDSNFPTTEHDIMVWADKNNIGRSKIGTTFKYNRIHDRLGRFGSGGGAGGGAGGVQQQNAMADENNEPKLRGDHTYEATEKVVGVKLPAIQKAALRYAFGTNGGKIKADGSLEVSGVSKINASTNPQQWGEQKRGYAQIAVGSTHTAHLVSVDEIYRPRGSGLGRTAVIVFTENRN